VKKSELLKALESVPMNAEITFWDGEWQIDHSITCVCIEQPNATLPPVVVLGGGEQGEQGMVGMLAGDQGFKILWSDEP
jgi:hypothetical protein